VEIINVSLYDLEVWVTAMVLSGQVTFDTRQQATKLTKNRVN
jgi:hypothetical protein